MRRLFCLSFCSSDASLPAAVRCDDCELPAAHAMRTLAKWWTQSELSSSGVVQEPAVKLWIHLAEQAKGLGDFGTQFAAMVNTVTHIIRADVFAALTGDRSLDAVPWFSTLQLCPRMASDVLFSWDEYNSVLCSEGAESRFFRLPRMLIDVLLGSESTTRLLQTMAASSVAEVKLHAIAVIVENEDITHLDWAQRCIEGIAENLHHPDDSVRTLARECVVRNPSLLSHGTVSSAIRHDVQYEASLRWVICSRLDLFPWANTVSVV